MNNKSVSAVIDEIENSLRFLAEKGCRGFDCSSRSIEIIELANIAFWELVVGGAFMAIVGLNNPLTFLVVSIPGFFLMFSGILLLIYCYNEAQQLNSE